MHLLRHFYVSALVIGLLCVCPITLTSLRCFGTHDQLNYQENFEDGAAQDWELQSGWTVEQEPGGNWALRGQNADWAIYRGGEWADFTFTLRAKLISGILHINWRYGACGRYYIVFQEGTLFLKKVKPWGVNNEVASIPDDQIEPLPRAGNDNCSYIQRIGKMGDEVKILLDVKRLLYEEEIDQISLAT